MGREGFDLLLEDASAGLVPRTEGPLGSAWQGYGFVALMGWYISHEDPAAATQLLKLFESRGPAEFIAVNALAWAYTENRSVDLPPFRDHILRLVEKAGSMSELEVWEVAYLTAEGATDPASMEESKKAILRLQQDARGLSKYAQELVQSVLDELAKGQR